MSQEAGFRAEVLLGAAVSPGIRRAESVRH